MDGLAGAVDAALGRDIDVERPGRRTAIDAAIGQVEGRAAEVDEGIVAVGGGRIDHLRGRAAVAAGEARVEADIAVRVGRRFAEHVVVDGDEAELGAGHRLGGRERADDGVDAVAAGERGQAEVGDDEPLGGELAPLVRIELGLGGDDIDARTHVGDGVADRHGGRDRLVQFGRDDDLAFPDLLAALLADVLGAPGRERGEELVVADRRGEAAVADAVDGGERLFGVDRDDRKRGAGAGGQDIGIAGEADPRRAVADIDVELGRMGEDLAVGGGQPAADADLIAAAVLDAVDADLATLRLDGEALAAGNGDEVGKARVGDRQVIGEDDADARIGNVGVDIVGDDAEAVLGDDLVVGGADRGVLDQRQAGAIGAIGQLPLLAPLEAVAHERERLGLVVRRFGADEAVDARRR